MICVFQVGTLCWFFNSPSNYSDVSWSVTSGRASVHVPRIRDGLALLAGAFYTTAAPHCLRRDSIEAFLSSRGVAGLDARFASRLGRRDATVGWWWGRGGEEAIRKVHAGLWRHYTRGKGQDEDDTHKNCNFVNLWKIFTFTIIHKITVVVRHHLPYVYEIIHTCTFAIHTCTFASYKFM